MIPTEKCSGFPGRSLDSTELVDPVTLKVIAGPRMGTRRRLDRRHVGCLELDLDFPATSYEGCLRMMNDEE